MMRAAIVVLAASCAARHSLPAEDRRVIEEFRVADRAALHAGRTTQRQFEYRLTDDWEAGANITAAAKQWRVLRARMANVTLHDKALDRLFQQYLVERDAAWTALERSFGWDDKAAAAGIEYRSLDEAATKTGAALDAELAKLDVAALPPLTPDAAPVFTPPPSGPPGAAYFLVDHTVVALDDAGFHVVAEEIGYMHVAENGIVWACGNWHAVKWDGKTATTYKMKIYNAACAAGPDGKLWIFADDLDHRGRDQIASFDGVQWKVTTASLGGSHQDVAQIIVARDSTVYGLADRPASTRDNLFVLDKGKWRNIPRDTNMPSHSVEHIFVGGDGNPWIIHQTTTDDSHNPDALSRFSRAGVEKAVYTDDHFQTGRLFAAVDAAGIVTIYDQRRNVIVQGKQSLRLPKPNAGGPGFNLPGGFAYDAAGRIWVELEDGLSVIDATGKRHVFPRGSIPAIHTPISQIHVVGAGPTLPPPAPAVTRTITGTLRDQGNAITGHEIRMCERPTYECGKGVDQWTARTDQNGTFTFENVPMFRYSLAVFAGERNRRYWRSLTGECCDGIQSVLDFGIEPGPIY